MSVDPRDFLLLYRDRDEFPAQYRGISPFASAVVDALDESDILDFMKLTMRWQASMPGVLKTEEGDDEDANLDWPNDGMSTDL